MAETKHTPLDWEIYSKTLIRRNGEQIISVNAIMDDAEETAKLIVRAVNNHATIVEALEGMVEMYEKAQPAGGYQGYYEEAVYALKQVKQ